MTTGAAQTLWRSYRTLPGARVAVAGSGPLNMQVALELARGGATIVLLAEAAPRPVARPGAALAMAAADPGLALTGLGFLAGLARRGVPVAHLSAITAIEPAPGGAGAGLVVHARGPGGAFRVEADAVCLNDGFQPQNEVLRLLGVRMHYDARFDQLRPERDATMQTSLPGIFAAGDCCGLGGARAAREEGLIAGAAAAAHAAGRPIPALPAARRRLARARRFQAALWRLFEPGPGPLDSLAPEVPVCRCENVTRAQIDAALAADIAEIGALKRATRAGMGRCQGRFCQPVLARLVTARAGRLPGPFDFFAPRVPIRPVAIEALLAAGSAGAVPAAPWSGGPPDAQAGMPPAPDAGDG
ncbi:MAG: hypothetical protein KatS3mg118_1819 [Paracoccaceae bacterium]|nr:MAG: hypothetical protein KatS3mg118_1819 [Paracoccaceae bacterium]